MLVTAVYSPIKTCPACGYDLHSATGACTCPECGTRRIESNAEILIETANHPAVRVYSSIAILAWFLYCTVPFALAGSMAAISARMPVWMLGYMVVVAIAPGTIGVLKFLDKRIRFRIWITQQGVFVSRLPLFRNFFPWTAIRTLSLDDAPGIREAVWFGRPRKGTKMLHFKLRAPASWFNYCDKPVEVREHDFIRRIERATQESKPPLPEQTGRKKRRSERSAGDVFAPAELVAHDSSKIE